MVQTEKLAGLGQMVAGVAHEINNPLAFVTNNVAVLQRDVGEIRELLALYGEADDPGRPRPARAGRAGSATSASGSTWTTPWTNLHGLLDRTARGPEADPADRQGPPRLRPARRGRPQRGRPQRGHRVDRQRSSRATPRRRRSQLEHRPGPLPRVTCYAAKINQVVMNLLANAIDACADGGHGRPSGPRAEDGDGVRIDVLDNGRGIDPAIRDRIFDPFFTTKPIGEGTGPGPVDQLRDRPGPRRHDRGRLRPRARARGSPSASRSSRR